MKTVERGLAEQRQQLLTRILCSREFAHAHILKRILQYLCERSANPQSSPPKEYEIALEAMGRTESFDPRTDPIVRVSIASIRDRLLAYFAMEGRHERLRLQIPKGHYLPIFTDAIGTEQATEAKQSRALLRFWKPYFCGQAANVVVYTEPLFFRDDSGHYYRDWYVNDLLTGPEEVAKRLLIPGQGKLQPSFHYLSTGEVHCMLSISRMFHEAGVPLETRNSRVASWNELKDSNLILLGSPRTNSFLSTLQGEEPFVINSDRIENRKRKANEEEFYLGRRYLDGKLMRMSEYSLVTRRPGLSPRCAVTMIAANHGRAIEGAGHFLTLEDRVRALLKGMGLDNTSDLPQHFQMLMHVETIDVDDEVTHVHPLAHRFLPK
jgi:hypothetical protein